jgi:ATP synthase F1 gamma subunit
VCLAVLALPAGRLAAQATELQAGVPVVQYLDIIRQDVADTNETSFPARAANALHVRTRERVVEREVLPIPETLLHAHEDEEREDQALRGDFIYEPEPEEILQRLLPVYLETEIYRALLESAASFLAAQMTAMRNASKNAGELIDRYTLQLNRARQAQITQEILEIVAGADALTQ